MLRPLMYVAEIEHFAKNIVLQFPYAKRAKTGDYDTSNMTDKDRAFHDSMKPSWGPDGTLVYAAPPNAKPFGRSSRRARERDGILSIQKQAIVSENRDIHFAKVSNEVCIRQFHCVSTAN
jgi:nuclear pore complex protein Nup98-Nup96